MHSLFSLNKYIAKYKYHFWLGVLFIVLSNYFALFPAEYVRESFDSVVEALKKYELAEDQESRQLIANQVISYAGKYGLLIVLMALIKGIFTFFNRQTIIIMSRRIEYDMKNDIYAHCQRLDMDFYNRHATGDIMNRISEDVSRVRMYLGPGIMYSLNLLVLFVMVITVMIHINMKLTLIALSPMPVLMWVIYRVSRSINEKSVTVQASLSIITQWAQETFSGIRVIKAMAKEKVFQELYEKESERYKNQNISLMKTEALFHPSTLLLIGISTLLTVYYGGMEVIRGNISYGNVAEFVIYVNMLTWPVTSVGWVLSIIQRAAVSQARINDFLWMQPSVRKEEGIDIPSIHSIVFEKVSYRYPHKNYDALHNISFAVKKGDKVGIIGKTGAGKSTLLYLIMRMIEPTEGKVYMNGQDIVYIRPQSIREKIGYVPQDIFLFSDTISGNIAFGLKEYQDEDPIMNAARVAQIHANIMDFPHAYQTLVGERGVTLSGGQKQRVSIARALIKDPEVLIFDDSFSAIDSDTEYQIMQNFQAIWKNKTVFISSHKVSVMRYCDYILVMDNGNIVESGTHDKLLAKNGLYARLHYGQVLEKQRSSQDTHFF